MGRTLPAVSDMRYVLPSRSGWFGGARRRLVVAPLVTRSWAAFGNRIDGRD